MQCTDPAGNPRLSSRTSPNSTWSSGGRPDTRLAADDLLDGPAVAVRVGEEHEPAPGKVLDLADLDPAVGEVGVGGLDVVDHHLQAGDRAGRGVGDADPERDRAGRAGRGQLDEAELVADLVVVVGVEADLLGVEALGAVDVADGDRHQLELEVHGRRPLAGRVSTAAAARPYRRGHG